MLNKRKADFRMLVWETAKTTGNSATKIADIITRQAFPKTAAEAEYEGADVMLRKGVIAEVKEILKTGRDPNDQYDFGDFDARLKPYVRELKSKTYFVESAGEYVSVRGLVEEPALLDDARKFMRRKSEECLEEAKNLDALYNAVMRLGRR